MSQRFDGIHLCGAVRWIESKQDSNHHRDSEGERVVAVVGAGHVQGMLAALSSEADVDLASDDPRVLWDGGVPAGESSCVSCGHCVTVCPCNALILSTPPAAAMDDCRMQRQRALPTVPPCPRAEMLVQRREDVVVGREMGQRRGALATGNQNITLFVPSEESTNQHSST